MVFTATRENHWISQSNIVLRGLSEALNGPHCGNKMIDHRSTKFYLHPSGQKHTAFLAQKINIFKIIILKILFKLYSCIDILLN